MRAIAKRYARALVEVALQQNQAEGVRRELAMFAQVVGESLALRSVLANPAISREKKQGIINRIAAQTGTGKIIHNFLMILVENRRAQLLPQIREAYDEQLNLKMVLAEADVTSARELTADEKTKLVAALGRMTGKKVAAHYRQDANLIGGTVVRVGSTIYNGSVRDQLKRMRERLAAD